MQRTDRNVRDLLYPALFAALISILSLIILPLPFSPVPVTGQTLGVLLAGLTLKPRQALTAVAVYLLLGVAGAPVFSGGSGGVAVLVGPGGGYLAGFLMAAPLAAIIRKGRTQLWPLAIAALAATTVIYIPGMLWLARVTGLGLRETIVTGLLPYLPGDLFKSTVAIMAAAAVKGRYPMVPD